MRPPRLQLKRSTWTALFLAPVGLAVVCSVLLVHEPAALLAPLLGPWAGSLLGHGECTFASFARAGTLALCILGPATFLGWLRVPAGLLRELLAVLLLAWTTAWLAAGVLSVLNTTS